MDPVSSIADALASLRIGDITYDLLHKDQRELIDAAIKQCQADEQVFAESVLRGDAGTCNLLLDGLRHDGPAPLLTSGQADQLRDITPKIDGATLLRLYCLGREGDLAVRVREILQTADAPKK